MESDLTLKLSDYQTVIAREAGYPPTSSGRTTDQTTRIAELVASAFRFVYFTEAVRDDRGGELIPANYNWSWLKPISFIELKSGNSTLDLPEDFNGFLADALPYSTTQSNFFVPIRGEQEVSAMRGASPSATGRPLVACKHVKADPGTTVSSRWELEVFPTADADYRFKVWYSIIPQAPTEARPYPLGGASLTELYKAACLAAVEIYVDGGGNGSRQDFFRRRLQAAIEGDRNQKPQSMGPFFDPSDTPFPVSSMIAGNPISVNGITPGYA